MKTKIKEVQEQQVDWDVNPQLVISKEGTVVLVVHSQSGGKSFAGVCVHATGGNDLSDFSTEWDKKIFSPFHGTIELSND